MASYHKDLSDLKDPHTFVELTEIFSNIVFNCLYAPDPAPEETQIVCGITPMDAGDDVETYVVEVKEKNGQVAAVGNHMFKLIANLNVLFYSAGLKTFADEQSFWVTLTRDDLDILIMLHRETTLTPEIRPGDVIPLLQ